MRPIDFIQANRTFRGGDAMPDVRVHDNGHVLTTCFELNKEDLEIINATGKIWLKVLSRKFAPTEILAASPFQVPRPLHVHENVTNRVAVFFYDGLEVVAVVVRPTEYAFKIVPVGQQWVITLKDTVQGCGRRFASHYAFGEPLTIFGLASEHYGRFDELAAKLKTPPENLLILERVQKT